MPRKPKAPLPPARQGYHHGSLRQTLIDASDSLLAERGVAGFSLREVARRSGVAPSAPAHHFGDTAGLLDAVAVAAFEGLTRALEDGNARGGTDPLARLREQGVGYVDFALRHPERFSLMFRTPLAQPSDALLAQAHAAFQVLENGVRDFFGVPTAEPLGKAAQQTLLTVWSVVHGFAHLAIAGQLELFAPGDQRDAFVRATLRPMLQQLLDGLAPAKRSAAKARPIHRASRSG